MCYNPFHIRFCKEQNDQQLIIDTSKISVDYATERFKYQFPKMVLDQWLSDDLKNMTDISTRYAQETIDPFYERMKYHCGTFELPLMELFKDAIAFHL